MAAGDDDSWLFSDVPSDYVCTENACACHVNFKRPLAFEHSPSTFGKPKSKRKDHFNPIDSYCPRSSRSRGARNGLPRATCATGNSRQSEHVCTKQRGKPGRVKRSKQQKTNGSDDLKAKPTFCKLEIGLLDDVTTKHFIWQKRLRHRSPPEILVEDTPPSNSTPQTRIH
ncbi:uncharacterized protein LOC134188668 [Corticium candelabrum]|uniref:uncharacterized protein LOC134188668 n=1 Tax=Corticium candelabrum TaxID=121492 RepID=UPI002E266215|nr:uncharacterized protein LOC134188668 [Corticium candelabrum]